MARYGLPVGLTCSCLCILFILHLPSGLPAWPRKLALCGIFALAETLRRTFFPGPSTGCLLEL